MKFNKTGFYLRLNFIVHKIYLSYIASLVKKGKHKKATSSIEKLARLYSKNYVGLLASIELEHLLKRIGEKTINKPKILEREEKKSNSYKILHIATEFYDVGGHTRVVQDWIRHDIHNKYEILLTDQKANLTLDLNAPIHKLNTGDYFQKAFQLRSLVFQEGFDKVIIHQHMHDVIPTLAFWDFQKENYNVDIIFYVHSDFRFSLGNIISNKRICYSSGHIDFSNKYRNEAVPSYLLPFPLENNLNTSFFERTKICDHLKLDSSATNILVIGSAYKFKPFKKYNLLKEWNKYLAKKPNVQLIVIGCSDKDFSKFCPNEVLSSNLILKGIVVNPTEYYKIADYCINTYPIPTGLGLYSSMSYGSIPILGHVNVLATKRAAKTLYPKEFTDLMDFKSKEDYFDFIDSEIENKVLFKLAQQVLPRFFGAVSIESWRKELEFIYKDKVTITSNYESKQNDKQNLIKTQESLNWFEYNTKDSSYIVLLEELLKSRLPITKIYALKILALGFLFKPLYTSKAVFKKVKKKLKF